MNSNQTASDVVAGDVRLGDDSCHRRIMVWVVGYVRIHARTPATEGYSMKNGEKSVYEQWKRCVIRSCIDFAGHCTEEVMCTRLLLIYLYLNYCVAL